MENKWVLVLLHRRKEWSAGCGLVGVSWLWLVAGDLTLLPSTLVHIWGWQRDRVTAREKTLNWWRMMGNAKKRSRRRKTLCVWHGLEGRTEQEWKPTLMPINKHWTQWSELPATACFCHKPTCRTFCQSCQWERRERHTHYSQTLPKQRAG